MKKAILLLIGLVMLSSIVCAADIDQIILGLPTNNTQDNDGTVTFEFQVTGNFSTYNCYEYTNRSGTYTTDYIYPQNHTIQNNTNTSFTLASIPDGTYVFAIACNSSDESSLRFPAGDNDGTLSTGTTQTNHSVFTYFVDDTDPTLVLNDPSDLEWRTSGLNNSFNVTATDTNPSHCWIVTNLNTTSSTTGTWESKENEDSGFSTWTSGTALNLLWGYNTTWADNNVEGNYTWNYYCNDTAGNIGYLSSNVSFLVDSLQPTKPTITNLYIGRTKGFTGWLSAGNYSKSTDYTPKLNWTLSTETNFSKYWIRFDNDSAFTTPEYNINITNKSREFSIIGSGLSGDVDYFVKVTAIDAAGNSNDSAAYIYRTDSTCHTLKTGWNICSYIRTTQRNATYIANETDADYVSKYNQTHLFQTYTTGAATNADMTFNSSWDTTGLTPIKGDNEVMFIYVGSDTVWEHRLWEISAGNSYFTFTNESNEGWNIVPWYDQVATNFSQLDYSLNGNYTDNATGGASWSIQPINQTSFPYMSGYVEENATNKYPESVSNRSKNKGFQIDYGEAAWIWYDASKWGVDYTWNSTGEI